MIQNLVVENFKSIRSTGKNGIELKPLTIFTGPNSTGKSNLMEAIAFIAQTPYLSDEWGTAFTSILRHGPIISYPDISFLTFCREKLPIAMKLFFSLSPSEKADFDTSENKIGFELSYNPENGDLQQGIYLGAKAFVTTAFLHTERGPKSLFAVPKILREYAPSQNTDQILSSAMFNPIITVENEEERVKVGEILRIARMCTKIIFEKLKRIFLITTMRGSIPSAAKAKGYPIWVGKQADDLLSLLSLVFSKREYSEQAGKIRLWAERFGLKAITGGWWGNDNIGVDFEDPILKHALELSLASFGTRQVLSIIAQIYWSEKGDTIMIEEPETSLHPAMQVMLQELFAEAVGQGKQIICSTHSPFFILSISKAVKKKLISTDDIAVYHVEKNVQGTQVERLELNKHGFIASGVPSFMKVEEELFQEWSESLEEE